MMLKSKAQHTVIAWPRSRLLHGPAESCQFQGQSCVASGDDPHHGGDFSQSPDTTECAAYKSRLFASDSIQSIPDTVSDLAHVEPWSCDAGLTAAACTLFISPGPNHDWVTFYDTVSFQLLLCVVTLICAVLCVSP